MTKLIGPILIVAILVGIAALGVITNASADAGAQAVRNYERKVHLWDGTTSPVTWYGPGYYEHGFACGGTYHKNTRAVASNDYPCGTRLTLGLHSHIIRVVVRDTGGFSHRFDLTARSMMDLLGCRSYCEPFTIDGEAVSYRRGWTNALRPTPIL